MRGMGVGAGPVLEIGNPPFLYTQLRGPAPHTIIQRFPAPCSIIGLLHSCPMCIVAGTSMRAKLSGYGGGSRPTGATPVPSVVGIR